MVRITLRETQVVSDTPNQDSWVSQEGHAQRKEG